MSVSAVPRVRNFPFTPVNENAPSAPAAPIAARPARAAVRPVRVLESYGVSTGLTELIRRLFPAEHHSPVIAAIGNALAAQKKAAAEPTTPEARDRLAAEVALTEHLARGLGNARASAPLG